MTSFASRSRDGSSAKQSRVSRRPRKTRQVRPAARPARIEAPRLKPPHNPTPGRTPSRVATALPRIEVKKTGFCDALTVHDWLGIGFANRFTRLPGWITVTDYADYGGDYGGGLR